MNRVLVWAAALAGGAFAATATQADPCEGALPKAGTRFAGVVRYVGDGDSLCVGRTGRPSDWIEIRLADFYAPELHEAGGAAAKSALRNLALGRTLRCRAGRRSYDRVVATCTLNGVEIGELLREGGAREGGRGR